MALTYFSHSNDLDISLRYKAMIAASVKPCIEIVLCMPFKLAIMAW